MNKVFSVLSNTITPYYIHPEIETSSENLNEVEIKTYVNEEDKIVNTSLKKLDEKEYQIEYITFQQTELKENIKGYLDEIDALEIKSRQESEQIEKLKIDLEYLTDEEKIEQKDNNQKNVRCSGLVTAINEASK